MKTQTITFFASLFLLHTVFSQETEKTNLSDTLNSQSLELKEIIISSTRSDIKKENLTQKIEIITRENIEKTGANDLTDVLKKNAGVDVIQYPGMISGIGIRGFRPQYSGLNQRSLFLIDGRPAGASNMGTIDLSNVERIEVLKGPSSALYGSQAMGGVVNVITKKSTGELKKTVYVSTASYSTIDVGFNAGGSIGKKSDFDAGLKYYEQKDDYVMGNDNLFRDKFGWDKAVNTYRNNIYEVDSIIELDDARGDGEKRDNTGYQYQSGNVRFGHAINKNWRVDLGADFFSAHNVEMAGDIFDGTTYQSKRNPFRYGSNLSVLGKIKKHQVSAKIYNSLEEADMIPASAGFVTSISTNKWIGFQLQDNFMIKQHKITFGIDHNKANSSSRSFDYVTAKEKAPYSPAYGIYSTAGFVNANLSFFKEKLIATVGGRFDQIIFDVQETKYLETFKPGKETYGVFNPSAGFLYKLPYDLKIHSSAGTAFVTADAFNVAGYSVSGPGKLLNTISTVNVTYGNPDLKPERSSTIDGGINYLNKKYGIDLDMTYFNTIVNDRITTGQTQKISITDPQLTEDGDTIVSTTTFINADKSYIQGLEIGAAIDLGAFADYAYSLKVYANAVKIIKAQEKFRDKNITTEDVFRTLDIYNVADLTLLYGVEYSTNKFKTRLGGRYVGARKDTDWNDYIKRPEIEYPAFMVLDFSVSFKAYKSNDLNIQINNITDENYYEKRGFSMPGRTFKVKYVFNF